VAAKNEPPKGAEKFLKSSYSKKSVGGDDAADALRYLVATKARMVTQRKLRGV
jgi:hypothetical protein